VVKKDPAKIELPDRRVVLLGASNLVRGMPTALQVSQQKWGAPLDIMVAHGHGRSYGSMHRLVARSLRGIVDCGIWSALQNRPAANTAALLTDVGNDILYGATVAEIATWIEQCLERLRQFTKQIVVTELPLASIFSVSRMRFFLARQILFPTSRLTFEEAIEKVTQLNERIKQLAAMHDALTVEHDAQWYGVDPIHIRRRFVSTAWNTFLSRWKEEDVNSSEHFTLLFKARLRLTPPEERWLFGIQQQKNQPAIRLSNGTCVSFY
jgi:hypothetical protein